MKTEVRIKNNTQELQHIVVHPFLNLAKEYRVQQIGAYGKSAVTAKGTMYLTLSSLFYIAGYHKNPDGSSFITEMLPCQPGNTYYLKNNYEFTMQPNKYDRMFLQNDMDTKAEFLIFYGDVCIWKSDVLPSFIATLVSPHLFLSQIGISIWQQNDFPKFFKVDDHHLHPLGICAISLNDVPYITFTLDENIATKVISLSPPDYQPFPSQHKSIGSIE